MRNEFIKLFKLVSVSGKNNTEKSRMWSSSPKKTDGLSKFDQIKPGLISQPETERPILLGRRLAGKLRQRRGIDDGEVAVLTWGANKQSYRQDLKLKDDSELSFYGSQDFAVFRKKSKLQKSTLKSATFVIESTREGLLSHNLARQLRQADRNSLRFKSEFRSAKGYKKEIMMIEGLSFPECYLSCSIEKSIMLEDMKTLQMLYITHGSMLSSLKYVWITSRQSQAISKDSFWSSNYSLTVKLGQDRLQLIPAVTELKTRTMDQK